MMLDLSSQGALMETKNRLAFQQLVKLEVPAHKISEVARVRRCDQKGLRFRIGVEFMNARDIQPKAPRWT